MDKPSLKGLSGGGADVAMPGITSFPKPSTVQDMAPKNLQQWWWRRIRVRPKKFYKRVVLVTPHPPAPIWREVFSQYRWKVWVISYEGKYWIEHNMFWSALQTRVVRPRWPHQDQKDEPTQDAQLPIALMNAGLHTLQLNVMDDMVGPIRGRVKSGLLVLMVSTMAGFYLLPWLNWWQIIVASLLFFFWVRLTLQGGVGNVGVAKQVCGITNPFILTPYQLIKHVESRRELVDTEGVVVE